MLITNKYMYNTTPILMASGTLREKDQKDFKRKCTIFIICSLVDGHLDSFHFSVIVNKATINRDEHGSLF